MYPSCTTSGKLITPSFAPLCELKATVEVTSESPLLVCQRHYQLLYRQLTSLPCASCGIQPESGSRFTRHSTDVDFIKVRKM